MIVKCHEGGKNAGIRQHADDAAAVAAAIEGALALDPESLRLLHEVAGKGLSLARVQMSALKRPAC